MLLNNKSHPIVAQSKNDSLLLMLPWVGRTVLETLASGWLGWRCMLNCAALVCLGPQLVERPCPSPSRGLLSCGLCSVLLPSKVEVFQEQNLQVLLEAEAHELPLVIPLFYWLKPVVGQLRVKGWINILHLLLGGASILGGLLQSTTFLFLFIYHRGPRDANEDPVKGA